MLPPRKLSDTKFLEVINRTPLVSIDLIVSRPSGEVLLGCRHNRPAKGWWFVPGGRILKGEAIYDALLRISQREIGQAAFGGKMLGVDEHFYEDNALNAAGIDTHYVVIVFGVDVPQDFAPLADDQHNALTWWGVDDLVSSPSVHENTKRHFARARMPPSLEMGVKLVRT